MLQLNYSVDLQAIYLQQSTWVDNIVGKSDASYLYQKRGVYYFSKQVPCDVKQLSPKLLLKYRQGSMTFNCCKYAVYYCRPFAGVGNFVWGIWSLYVAIPGVVGN
jgi:hypothetical protein